MSVFTVPANNRFFLGTSYNLILNVLHIKMYVTFSSIIRIETYLSWNTVVKTLDPEADKLEFQLKKMKYGNLEITD